MAKKKASTPATDTLLVELLTEELPPKALNSLSETFAQELASDLSQRNLPTENSETHAFATPRRLAVVVTKVLGQAPDKPMEFTGPSAKVALDSEGKPTPALLGFAKKQGVDVSKLERQNTPKGEVFVYRTIARGGYLATGLDLAVEDALRKLPAPKIMRWGNGDAQFVRPVHGLLMMHGAKVVAGEVLGISSTNRTLGHRFLSANPIVFKHADDYEHTLRRDGKVEPGIAKRKQKIIEQLAKVAGRGAELVAGDALLDEITALVEWPVVHEGTFDQNFLEVPPECLILSMQQHQKYVPLRDRNTGRLLPRFLFVSNTETKNPHEIIHGNERVLHARLSDAKFFYDQDRTERLETRVPRLAHVVYHNKLGTQRDRTDRLMLLAESIARDLGADSVLAKRAAELSKADLLTGMVGEFPELQGVMGRYYALHDGEPRAAAEAIDQQYRPRFAGDKLPEGSVACAVALADKLYALAGMFGIGQQPTGEKDPFALRRHALGVIRILVEGELSLSLFDLVKKAFAAYPQGMIGDTHTDLENFLLDRMRSYLRDAGYTANEIESVLCMRPVRLDQVPRQLAAVRDFAALPEAASLASANKRVANILKQAEAKGESFTPAQAHALKETAERDLFEALQKTSERASVLFQKGDYAGYLKTFAVLKSPVDAFFDSVMVMVDEPEIRHNRLALLADLRREMNRVADISKLAVEK
ncbi:MAG TPA: glycine--tRNA ligase subunit beta [Burkholderiales bacterium]